MRSSIIMVLFSLFTLHASAQKKPALVEFGNPQGISTPTGYSHVAVVDLGNCRMLIMSGQVALNAQGELVGENDFTKQTEQVFRNIQQILQAYGGSFQHLVKTNYYITDANMVPRLREIRNQFINIKNPPASTLVEVKGLFRKELMIEVEATAILPK